MPSQRAGDQDAGRAGRLSASARSWARPAGTRNAESRASEAMRQPDEEHAVQRVGEPLAERGEDRRRQGAPERRLDQGVRMRDERLELRPGRALEPPQHRRELPAELGRQHGAHHRHADGAADRPEERRGRGRRAQVRPGHRVLHREEERHHDEAHPHAREEHVPRGDGAARAEAHVAHQEEGHREAHHAADDRPAVADPQEEPGRHHREGHPAQHERGERGSRLGGAAPEHALDEERDERDGPEHRHARQEPRHRGGPEHAVGEQPQRQERLRGAALPAGELDEEPDREGSQDVVARSEPPGPAALDEGGQEPRHAGREQRGAADVDLARRRAAGPCRPGPPRARRRRGGRTAR